MFKFILQLNKTPIANLSGLAQQLNTSGLVKFFPLLFKIYQATGILFLTCTRWLKKKVIKIENYILYVYSR